MGIKVAVRGKSMSMVSIAELKTYAAEKNKRANKARNELVRRKIA